MKRFPVFLAVPLLGTSLLVAFLSLLGVFGGGSTASDGRPTPAPSASAGPPTGSSTATPTPAESGPLIYIVQEGDTLGDIAAMFGVTVEALMEANGITDPASLQAGQQLIIPEGATQGPTITPAPGSEEPASPPPDGEVTLLQLVDKQHALPDAYAPDGLASVPAAYAAPGFSVTLRSDALTAMTVMLDAADSTGHDIRARSGYRSYAEQETTFNYWVSVLGYDEAVRVSAMPGHSEHQLGTAVDLTSESVGWDLVEGFGATAEGQWLAAHAHEYGFALSYPAGAEDITGYNYEPWHFRYIGDAAADWKASGLTLNQFLAANP